MTELWVLVYHYEDDSQIELFESLEAAKEFGHGIWETDFGKSEADELDGTWRKISDGYELVHDSYGLSIHIRKVRVRKERATKT